MTHSPCGEPAAPQDFAIPFSDKDLKLLVLTMSRKRSRRIDSQELEDARTIGGELFSSVFGDDIGASISEAAISAERAARSASSVESHRDTSAAEHPMGAVLRRIPRAIFVSTATHLRFRICLSRTHRFPCVANCLRILVMVSNPIDVNELDVEMETDKLRQALAPLEIDHQIALDVIPASLPGPSRKLGRQEVPRLPLHRSRWF